NRQRRLRGVSELQWNDAVADQARSHSINMMQRGFFSHIDPERGALVARLDAVGIGWTRCGENIYREKGLDDPVRSAVDGWMSSHEHRKSLVDPLFSQSGVESRSAPILIISLLRFSFIPDKSCLFKDLNGDEARIVPALHN